MNTPERKLLLLTGIPGTGKTTMGNHFHDKYGFVHINMEVPQGLNLFPDASGFLQKNPGDIVLSWGFHPAGTDQITAFRDRFGFRHVWLDGPRNAALRAFIERGTVEEKYFHIQMENIGNSNLVARMSPVIINPFDNEGRFRNKDDIAKEILALW